MKLFYIQALLVALAVAPVSHARELDFNRDVKPILSDKCYACHGPDAHDRKADLRLDTADGSIMDLGGYQAVVPGDHSKSEMFFRITTDDEDDLMPPPELGKDMTAEEIDILKRWIDSGAEYEKHWSYTPVAKPTPPEVEDKTNFVRNPIDQFVLRGLDIGGLQPAPEADAATLARRLSLDLHGLIPSQEQVSTLTSSEADQTYSQVVDQLLEQPAFGERLAMYWLDVVRYADSIGYHSDNPVEVSAYRDYVINAFNENLPYDRFVREQIAGDLLPDATLDQKVASGFNRLLQTTTEGGAQAKEYMAIYAADRVRNTSVAFLGSTIGCAQCHDHKYDPFTARDFYTFAAFFADIREGAVGTRRPNLKLPTPQQSAEMGELHKNLREHTFEVALANDPALAKVVEQGQKKWEANSSGGGDLKGLHPRVVTAGEGSTHTVAEDGTVKLGGTGPAKENLMIKAPVAEDGIYGGLVLHVLTDPEFVKGGVTREGNGNIVLTRAQVFHKNKEQKLAKAEADFEQKGYPASHALTNNGSQGWAIGGNTRAPEERVLLLHLQKPITVKAGDEIQVRLQHQSPHAHHTIGKMRFSLVAQAIPNMARDIGPSVAVAGILAKSADQRSEEETGKLRDTYFGFAPALDDLRTKRASWQERIAVIDRETKTMLISEALAEPRVTRILNRGDWMDQEGEIVQPAVPEFLAYEGEGKKVVHADAYGHDHKKADGEKASDPAPVANAEPRATRLDLADWIVDPRNPLTARTFVNRVWRLLIGRGLAANVTDIGGQGVPPTHPELLDWLAADFVESGWDVKHLVRTIVNSGTYRQSSEASEELLADDPLNEWVARQGRWRIDAEFVRDAALELAGLLVDDIGGRSVKPYQPEGYWAQLNFPKRSWDQDSGDSLYRRGIYVHWQRSFLHPAMLAFDAPSREECTAERSRSNIPQQALVLLNDPVFVEAARGFGSRILNDGGATDTDRLDWAWAEAIGRPSTDTEMEVLQRILASARKSFASDPTRAADLIATGESAQSTGLDPVELASWTTIARTLINTYETTSRF